MRQMQPTFRVLSLEIGHRIINDCLRPLYDTSCDAYEIRYAFVFHICDFDLLKHENLKVLPPLKCTVHYKEQRP